MNNQARAESPVPENDKPILTLVDADADPTANGDIETGQFEPLPAEAQPSESRFVYLNSLAIARLDRFTLIRVFRDQWRKRFEYNQSDAGGSLSLEDAITAATQQIDELEALKTIERLLTQPAETISFQSLCKLWSYSPADAEFVFQEMKQEARREFQSGHLAAAVFEPVEWMRSAWQRAKFLAVRDSFIDEYEPEGGIEIALIDTMAQAYFLQLHWVEESVKRSRANPRRLSEEYREHQKFKRESPRSAPMWNPGDWELSLATELECQEQAIKLADHFARLFIRTVRTMDNHRLAKAKLQRLKLRATRRSVDEQLAEELREKAQRLDEVRRAKDILGKSS